MLSEDHGHKVLVVVKIVAAVRPVIDLRKQNDLNDLLEDGEGTIDCEPEPEFEVIEIGTLAGEVELGQRVPMGSERSKDRKCHDVREDLSHELSIEVADHDPADEDWSGELQLGLEPIRVSGDIPLMVKVHPKEHGAERDPEIVHAVPAHGLGISPITNEASHSVLGPGTFVTTVDLRVTHLLSIKISLFKF